MYVDINLQLLYCFTFKGNVLNSRYLRNWDGLGFCASCFLNIMEDRQEMTHELEDGKERCTMLYSWTCSNCGYLHKTKPVKNSIVDGGRVHKAPPKCWSYITRRETHFSLGGDRKQAGCHAPPPSGWSHTHEHMAIVTWLNELKEKRSYIGAEQEEGVNTIKIHIYETFKE